MKIIFAQGNPGNQYEKTRHNIGWMVIDKLAKQLNAAFIHKPKFSASIAESSLNGEKILLVKPLTFYNDTGVSARALIDFYKISTKDILVLHDDLMIDFGKLRIRLSGRDAGNNGVKSLNAYLGKDFARLRIGIYTILRNKIHDKDFVLKKFTKDEIQLIEEKIIPQSIKIIHDFINDNLEPTSWSAL